MKWIKADPKSNNVGKICRYKWEGSGNWYYQINKGNNMRHLNFGKEVEILDESTPPEKTYSEKDLEAAYYAGLEGFITDKVDPNGGYENWFKKRFTNKQ